MSEFAKIKIAFLPKNVANVLFLRRRGEVLRILSLFGRQFGHFPQAGATAHLFTQNCRTIPDEQSNFLRITEPSTPVLVEKSRNKMAFFHFDCTFTRLSVTNRASRDSLSIRVR
jgi:hypothetical protein